MSQRSPTIRMHLWLETDEGVCFGLGRALLLAKIDEYGSLKQAAHELGMSYRAAWGKLKQTEAIIGVKLVTKTGNRREGCQLTPTGRMLMDRFLTWFATVEQEALRKAQEILPWPVKSYESAELLIAEVSS